MIIQDCGVRKNTENYKKSKNMIFILLSCSQMITSKISFVVGTAGSMEADKEITDMFRCCLSSQKHASNPTGLLSFLFISF